MGRKKSFPEIPIIGCNLRLLINHYFQKHSKVLFVRADIRYPSDYPTVENNLHIKKCMAKTMQYFNRQKLDPMYTWVREQNVSEHPHYHCIILLNGQKTQRADYVYNILAKYWGSTLKVKDSALIEYCDNNTNGEVIICKNGTPDYVLKQIGYLAKPFTKGKINDGVRNFGMSQLPKCLIKV